MKPSPMVEKVFMYCLACAAAMFGIQVHAFCVMSNHYHMVITDPRGVLPDFMSWFNEFVAKCLNRFWGRNEYFWSPGSYSAVRLETPDDVIEKIVYTLINPVKSFLVSEAGRWPGVTSLNTAYGQERHYIKPQIFFRKNGPMPDKSSLTLEVPEDFPGSAAEFKTIINERLREKEAEIKQISHETKHPFMGCAAVRAVRWQDRPESPEKRRNLNPHIASKNPAALRNGIDRLKKFRTAYKEARVRFDHGEAGVIFPFGTFGLRKIVLIAPNPP